MGSFLAQQALFVLVLLRCHRPVLSLSTTPPPPSDLNLSRRDAVLLTGGAVLYGKAVSNAFPQLSRLIDSARDDLGELRPKAHDDRARSTFGLSLERAASFSPPSSPIRVLEIGIGGDCRSVLRGLYDSGMERVASSGGMSLVGIDLAPPQPEKIKKAQSMLSEKGERLLSDSKEYSDSDITRWSFDYVQGDASSLPFSDGSFDVVTCCLSLCSVMDQREVLEEIKRVLTKNRYGKEQEGGSVFGWVEHVAVEEEDHRPFLAWQQQVLDPAQQLLADNCHLHRGTYGMIKDVFMADAGGSSRGWKVVSQERFFVNDMWPVTCQSCGVIEREA